MSPIEVVQERIKELEEKCFKKNEIINKLILELNETKLDIEKSSLVSEIRQHKYCLSLDLGLLKFNKEIFHYLLTGERRVING